MDEAEDDNSTVRRWPVTVEIEARSLNEAHIAMIRYVAAGQRWDQLQDKLASINKAADAPQADERSLCGAALTAHIEFHDGDPLALEADNARMLKRALAALHDADCGTLGDLLKPRNVSGRPTHLTEHKLRGVRLGVLRQITLLGRSAPDAARFVANRLWKLGVRDGHGKKIAWQSLLNQLHRIDRQPQDTQDAYDDICKAAPALTAGGSEQETIEKLLNMLEVVRSYS